MEIEFRTVTERLKVRGQEKGEDDGVCVGR